MFVTLGAPFRRALEFRQRVGNPGVQLIRAPMLQDSAPPSRREGKLSAEAYAAGGRVKRKARDVIVNRNAERQARRQIHDVLRVVYVLDGNTYSPLSTELSRLCLNTLSRLRGTRRRNGKRLSVPPLGIIGGLAEQIPDALRGCANDSDGAHAKRHCLILPVWSPIPTFLVSTD